MSLSRISRFIAIGLAGATLLGTAGEAFAAHSRYDIRRHGGGYYRHRGVGAGPAIAGAALGIIGGAVAGAAANQYYNGYPAYSYGPGYGGNYGYDYHPGHGYYGPY